MQEIVHIESISDMHDVFGLTKPKHPLVSVIRFKDTDIRPEYHHVRCSFGMYCITQKNETEGSMGYGRSSYDFQEGSMVFIKPGQVLSYDGHKSTAEDPGWALLFHPDLIRKSELGSTIDNYSFFSYDITEALHLSDEEKQTLNGLVAKIEKEYQQNIDRHSQKLINANIELLLDYCTRYYDRQFYTRTNLNKDVLTKFEHLLKEYYANENQLNGGIPSVDFCGEELHMSPKYLSDLLKKETGKSAKAHIDDFLMNKAKNRLLRSTESVSEIAYGLGYEYSQHFSKIFKAKTGMSPSEYRSLN
ncbi:helix-turn-helix domain-containing protein [Allomuricauda sp. SCSIO 65647]|uniref:helix-turn-helix domain-containing protein n=1 Tax=Allomuricauda sp. SCSIO 65647 TaxID=2908843 RepID=UPI001F34362F|nr:AraC family transcriptional regulator [Muricauda sp. SCSIO 65647]UJH67347.1 helix-turn-helix transcriptional regulator [Muricauda sp. SCSIO 65647]